MIIKFLAEVSNMVYDLGRIMQSVRQPKLQVEGDVTLSEALSFFGDELSTDNRV